jgi:hypothetical protein
MARKRLGSASRPKGESGGCLPFGCLSPAAAEFWLGPRTEKRSVRGASGEKKRRQPKR